MADSLRSQGIRCVIVTPESTVLDTTARGVILPLDDGLRGVARGHAPFIGRLGAGEVRLASSEAVQGNGEHDSQSVFIEGGFVEVAHDQVTVITQRAVPVEKLDPEAARSRLERVRSEKAVGEEAIVAKERELATARAAMKASRRAAR